MERCILCIWHKTLCGRATESDIFKHSVVNIHRLVYNIPFFVVAGIVHIFGLSRWTSIERLSAFSFVGIRPERAKLNMILRELALCAVGTIACVGL